MSMVFSNIGYKKLKTNSFSLPIKKSHWEAILSIDVPGILSMANILRAPQRMEGQCGVGVCFFHLSVTALWKPGFQEGRVEFAETWPSKLRKGGRSSWLLGYSTPSFTGSRANDEMNSSSVL
jgi:hypothetical protein